MGNVDWQAEECEYLTSILSHSVIVVFLVLVVVTGKFFVEIMLTDLMANRVSLSMSLKLFLSFVV